MRSVCCCLLCLLLFSKGFSHSPDFISQFVENAKLAYADNGYRVVQEKTFSAYDIRQGLNSLSCQLGPGDYFVQLITEPCLKINVAVKAPVLDGKEGIVSEKPEMRASIAIFNVPEHEERLPTEIVLSGETASYCFPAKARVLVYQRIAY